jgi:DNA-binding MarR family transcriptional regulator
MAGADAVKLRDVSRAAFGQQYRLEVMLAASRSEDGLVCLTDLARDLGLSVSNVQGALKSLVALRLLTEMPAGDSRRKFYLRNPSAAWAWAEEMAREASKQFGSQQHH